MGEWKSDILINLLDSLIDYRGKTPKKTPSGVPLVTAKIIKGGRILPFEEFIAEDDYDSWMVRGLPQPEDVVLTTEAPLGEVAQLDNAKVALAQRVVTLRGKKGILDNTYLKYFLQSDIGQKRLSSRATGTTVTGIKQSELRKVLITYPDYDTQCRIAAILKSLDDKIALNDCINHNLEEQAQALYKSWFVDFEPFKEEEFVESELGMIPEGWTVCPLDSMCSIISRGFSPKYNDAFDDYVLGQRCVRNNLVDVSLARRHEPRFLGNRELRRWDILINSTGMGSLGRVAQVYFSPCRMTFDSHLTLVRTSSSYSQHFVGRNLLSRQDEIENLAVGSTGQTELPRERVKALPIICPPESIMKAFGKMIKALAELVQKNIEINAALARERDEILPQLMSGRMSFDAFNN